MLESQKAVNSETKLESCKLKNEKILFYIHRNSNYLTYRNHKRVNGIRNMFNILY